MALLLPKSAILFADIRKDGGVARMSDPGMVTAIKAAVTIPVMAKARIGHFVEAQILEALDIDYIDESEVRRCALTSLKLRAACSHCWQTLVWCRTGVALVSHWSKGSIPLAFKPCQATALWLGSH